ncbi:hypothetical protein OROGR_004107 [Orobanche gracilis]
MAFSPLYLTAALSVMAAGSQGRTLHELLSFLRFGSPLRRLIRFTSSFFCQRRRGLINRLPFPILSNTLWPLITRLLSVHLIFARGVLMEEARVQRHNRGDIVTFTACVEHSMTYDGRFFPHIVAPIFKENIRLSNQIYRRIAKAIKRVDRRVKPHMHNLRQRGRLTCIR